MAGKDKFLVISFIILSATGTYVSCLCLYVLGLTNIVTVAVVLLAITYFVITRRSRFTVELETTVETDPKTCMTYIVKEMDNFAMKFHPYM